MLLLCSNSFVGSPHVNSLYVVQVVGAPAELGAWNVDAAPTLRYDGDAGVFVGALPLPAGAVGSEYKLAAKNAAKPAAGWAWLEGPNRRVTADGAPVTVSWVLSRDGTDVIAQDGYLEPHRGHLQHRYRLFTEALAVIDAHGGGLDAFSRGWEHYGFNRATVRLQRDGTRPGAGATAGARASPAPFPPLPCATATSCAALHLPTLLCPQTLQQGGRDGIIYREWAPAATAAWLVGDFNGWDKEATPCAKDEFVRQLAASACAALMWRAKSRSLVCAL